MNRILIRLSNADDDADNYFKLVCICVYHNRCAAAKHISIDIKFSLITCLLDSVSLSLSLYRHSVSGVPLPFDATRCVLLCSMHFIQHVCELYKFRTQLKNMLNSLHIVVVLVAKPFEPTRCEEAKVWNVRSFSRTFVHVY